MTEERLAFDDLPRSRKVIATVAVGVASVTAFGGVIVTPRLDGDAKIVALIAINLVQIFAWLLVVQSGVKERIAAYMPILLALTSAVAITRRAAEAESSGIQIAVAIVVLVLFVAPAPVFLLLVRRNQDELQRSLAASSALIALVALVLALLGYHVLDVVLELPVIRPGVIGAVAAGFWAATWGAMRLALR